MFERRRDGRTLAAWSEIAAVPLPGRAVDGLGTDNLARLHRLATAALTPERVESYRSRITAAANDVLTGIGPTSSPIDMLDSFTRSFAF